MSRFADRVAAVTLSTGTGPVTLGATIAGYQSWATAFTDGQVFYGIVDENTGEWEVGEGTLLGGTQLTRDTIMGSSFGGAAVSFVAGPKTVYCPEPAESRPHDMGLYPAPQRANPLRILRNSTAAARPTGRVAGELYVNLADRQMGYVDANGVAQDLLNGSPIGLTTPSTGRFSNLNVVGQATFENNQIRFPGTVGSILVNAASRLFMSATEVQQPGATTEVQTLRVGVHRTGNGQSRILLNSDASLVAGVEISSAAGVNGVRSLISRGTGTLQIRTDNAASVDLMTTSLERMRILADGRIGFGTLFPADGAQFDFASNTGGVAIPRLSTVQRDAIAAPANGVLIFNTTLSRMQIRAFGAWENVPTLGDVRTVVDDRRPFATPAEAITGVRTDVVMSPALVRARQGAQTIQLTGRTFALFDQVPPEAVQCDLSVFNCTAPASNFMSLLLSGAPATAFFYSRSELSNGAPPAVAVEFGSSVWRIDLNATLAISIVGNFYLRRPDPANGTWVMNASYTDFGAARSTVLSGVAYTSPPVHRPQLAVSLPWTAGTATCLWRT